MPTYAKTHEDCRMSVCFYCLCKADRQLTDGHKTFIQENLFEKFRKYADLLPSGTCGRCRKNFSLKLDMRRIDYEELICLLENIKPATRNSPQCPCKICLVGRSDLKQVQKKAFEKKIRGRPRSSSFSPPKPPKKSLCTVCFCEYGPGLPHPCGKEEKLKNLEKTLSPNTQEQLASIIIKKKIEEGSEIQLKTKGRPMRGMYLRSDEAYFIFFSIFMT